MYNGFQAQRYPIQESYPKVMQ